MAITVLPPEESPCAQSQRPTAHPPRPETEATPRPARPAEGYQEMTLGSGRPPLGPYDRDRGLRVEQRVDRHCVVPA